ncbi:hypothetical protein HQ560_02975, partial [bacterium]|nr:hypothetical protein [bacterium]
AKHLLVNGKPVDIRACMWAPSDALLRPDPARVERLLAHAKKCGFNALFVQDGAFEADGLYDLCDKAGILVLQGLPRAGQGVDVEVYLANAEAMIRRLRGRASIVAWCVDGANRHLAARAVALCSAVDPNRLIADGPTEGEMRLWSTQIDPKTNVVHWRSMPLPCAGDVASPPTRASLGGEDLPWPASGIWPGDGPPSLAAAAYGPAPSAWRHILSGQAAQAAALQRALERARLTGGSSVVQQLNEPAPSSSAALVDYRGIPKPAYYAALRARAATAIFLDAGAETPATLTVGAPLKGAVCVQSATPLKGARVRAELFDTQMRPLGDWNAMVDLEAKAVARPLAVDWTPKLEQAGDVVFLHLALSDADGKPIVSDLVWLGIEAAQPATAKLRVAWLGAEPRGVLADKAFLAAAGIALVTPDDEMLDPADDARKPFEGIDVIVVDAATALDDYLDADMRSVADAVRRGCGLLALGQSHVLHDSALGLLLPTDRPADKVTGQAQQPTAAVPTHPVLGRIAFGTCPDLAARAASTATADAMVLAQFDPEHPLLVERSEGQGRVLALLTRPGELAGWGDGRRFYAGLLAYVARLGYADLSRLVDAATPSPLRALGTLKPATVEATLRKHENGAMVVLKNTSDTLAFLLVLEAEGEGAGAVHFSDNGFWLMPGKSAGVIVSTPNGKRNYKLTLQGWNTPRTPIR